MTRPTYLEIDLPRLRVNINTIRQHVFPARICVMLKANAYGHGVERVAPFIEPFVDMLGVALLEEGMQLRSLGIQKPILVAGGAFEDQLDQFAKNDLRVTISSYEILRAAENYGRQHGTKIKVHLKIDTGMQRSGIRWYEAGPFLEESLTCSNLEIEGIYTHLANSEVPSNIQFAPNRPFSLATEQLTRFDQVLEFYSRKNLPFPPIRHAANSGGILNFPESHLDMVRPGIMFYGIYPGGESLRSVEVKPAARWYSKLAYSKEIKAGDPVSYGSLWAAEVNTKIGTVPCGYGDGYFRLFSGKSDVLVNGRRKKQVGRICMDQFVVDLGQDTAKTGDPVILLGEDPTTGECISADELAGVIGTNAYEIMTNISTRVPRVFLED